MNCFPGFLAPLRSESLYPPLIKTQWKSCWEREYGENEARFISTLHIRNGSMNDGRINVL